MESRSLANLNQEQCEAVRHTEGPTLIVAGPGSGKTRVLTQKIAYLIETEKAQPDEILAVTFTNKAAQEMQERVEKLLTKGLKLTTYRPAQPWIGTFHATCAKILRRDGQTIGISPSFIIYDEGDQRRLLKKLIEKTVGPSDLSRGRLSPAGVGNAIEAAKRELIGPQEYSISSGSPFFETVAKIYPEYQRALRKANALDFGDLIAETVRLFRENTAALRRWQNRFRYLLVDEYQDTNHAQYIFVKLLSAKHRNVCVVGDMAQAIYSWRGADFRNILRFEQDFSPVKVFRLPQNYRSTKTILAAAKNLIENNRTHIPLDLRTENEEGNPIVVYEARNELDEASYIVRTINNRPQRPQIRAPKPTLSASPLTKASVAETSKQSTISGNYSNFAVLYRTNAQSRVIEEAFIRAGIPYLLVGGTKFYERREIKDILAYLRLLLNPEDLISRERAEKIGKRRLAAFDELPSQSGLLRQPAMKILDTVLKKTAYLDYLDDGTEEGLARIDNVKELRSVASSFDSLTNFLEHVSLVDLNDNVKPSNHPGARSTDRRNAVTLMTLHAAKGLEFPIIFIAGVEEGLLPHSRSMDSRDELEEERRLTYVGITRAKKEVHLTHTQERLLFGSRSQSVPSRFLSEIGDEYLCYHSPWD